MSRPGRPAAACPHRPGRSAVHGQQGALPAGEAQARRRRPPRAARAAPPDTGRFILGRTPSSPAGREANRLDRVKHTGHRTFPLPQPIWGAGVAVPDLSLFDQLGSDSSLCGVIYARRSRRISVQTLPRDGSHRPSPSEFSRAAIDLRRKLDVYLGPMIRRALMVQRWGHLMWTRTSQAGIPLDGT
jgi:hypothetical protein